MKRGSFDSIKDHVILSFWKKAAYGVGGATHVLLNNGVGQIVLIYTIIFGVDPLIVGTVQLQLGIRGEGRCSCICIDDGNYHMHHRFRRKPHHTDTSSDL